MFSQAFQKPLAEALLFGTLKDGGTAFGVITNTRLPTGDSGSARQIQFAAKLLF